MLPCAAVLALLLLATSARAAEFEGEGTADVVGGNIASARARALRQARREAFLSAVRVVLRLGPAAALPQAARGWAEAREAGSARRYRVLAEERTELSFRVRVAVSLDVGRLRDELAGVAGGPGRQPRDATASPGRRLGVWLVPVAQQPELLSADLRQKAVEQLRTLLSGDEIGTTVVSGDALDEAVAAAARQGCSALVTLQLTGHASPGVRGLGLSGATAGATIRLLPVAGEERVGQQAPPIWRGEGHAAAVTSRRAAAQALRRAVTGPVQGLQRTLRAGGRVVGPSEPRGDYRVLLKGLQSLGQQRKLCRQLRSRSARVGACVLLGFGQGGVVLRLVRAPASGTLARIVRRAARDLGLQALLTHSGSRMSTVQLSALPLPTNEL